MNECDADRVLQIRQAVREQAHCELPAVEKIGDAAYRWLTWEKPANVWLILCLFLVFYVVGRVVGVKSAKSSRKSS